MDYSKFAGHTPGPWSYSGEEDGDFIIWSGDDFVANVGSSRMQEVGVAFDADMKNAPLLAAAPALLAENRKLWEALRYAANGKCASCLGTGEDDNHGPCEDCGGSGREINAVCRRFGLALPEGL